MNGFGRELAYQFPSCFAMVVGVYMWRVYQIPSLAAARVAKNGCWLVGWMAGWLVGWLVGRVRAQRRGCTRAALTHGRVVAAVQCGAGANSGHGIGHRNMFHFFRVACDAQGRGVIIQAHTYNVAAVRGKSASCARVICRVTRVLI